MSKKKNNNSRSFSFTKPILYNGALYPSVEADISYADGSTQRGSVFTDDKGQYFTLGDNGSAVPVMTLNTLPEVSITPSMADAVSQSVNNSQILSNDNTIVSSSTPRAYNPHLSSSAIRGAKAHASWEQAHPNLSSWGYAAAAAPFAVAATPLIGAVGQALAGTSLGQFVISGVNTAMANPVVNTVNTGLGLGFGAKGIHDVSHGIFTPGTALDLMGLPFSARQAGSAVKGLLSKGKSARHALPSAEGYYAPSVPEYSSAPVAAPSPQPLEGSAPLALPSRSMSVQLPNSQYSPASSTLRGLDSDVDAYVDSFFTHTPSSSRTALPAPPQEVILQPLPEPAPALSRTAMPYSPGEVPADAYNPFRGMTTAEIDAKQQRTIQDIINRSYNEQEAAANAQDALNIGREDEFNWDDYLSADELAVPNGYASRPADASSSVTGNPIIPFRARDTRKGELPYTDEEINALINPDGTLKKEVAPMDFVNTGAHGKSNWYQSYNTPNDVLRKYLSVTDPAVARREMQSIMRANPTGRSGIIVNTHSLDTSVDSTPLAYKMATRLGKKFHPLEGAVDEKSVLVPPYLRKNLAINNRVLSNELGISNFFKQGYGAEANRARALYKASPDYNAVILKDADGNMTAFELTDENGTFQIPLNSRQETLDIMNRQLHNFNSHYGTSYPDIESVPQRDGSLRPWYFGEQFSLPNIYGITYKKGGKIKNRRGLTF